MMFIGGRTRTGVTWGDSAGGKFGGILDLTAEAVFRMILSLRVYNNFENTITDDHKTNHLHSRLNGRVLRLRFFFFFFFFFPA